MSVLTLISSGLHIKLTQISLVDHKPKKIWGSVFIFGCNARRVLKQPEQLLSCPSHAHLFLFILCISLWVYPDSLCSHKTNQNEELHPAEPSKEGVEDLFFACIDSQLCPTAQTVAQHRGGILVEKKGCSSQMHTAEIREMLREGLQLLPLKSCWAAAQERALLVLVVGLAPGKRPIVRSRVALKTVINALEFNFMLLEI